MSTTPPMPFFLPGAARDAVYADLRDSAGIRLAEARRHVNELWSRHFAHVDPRLPERAREAFHSAYWELSLTAALRERGLAVVPWLDRRCGSEGPDIQLDIDGRVAWVEATVASAGDGDDRVARGELGVAREVPDDQIKLRLLNAIDAKSKQLLRFAEQGIVSRGEPCVIAVNAAPVPSVRLELHVPRIVRVLFPVGHEVLELDPNDRRVVGRHYSFRDSVDKKSGAAVSANVFGDGSARHVSAVLYSAADVFNRTTILGGDHIVVHNPQADDALPDDVVLGVQEYRASGDVVRRTV